MGPFEAEYSFLLTAIEQLKDLNKIIDVTSKDLLENIKRSDKKDADKIIRKIFNRLEVTCNLGSDKIQEILRNLHTDFKNYTQNKTEKEKANKKIVPVPMVTLPNVNDDSRIVETVENDSTNVNDDTQDIVVTVEKDSTTSNKAESNDVVNENNSDGNNTIIDDNSNEAKNNAEDDKVKLKLVAIEKLMDPKLLNNGPNQSIRSKNNSNNKTTRLKSISSDDDFVPISERKPVRNVRKLMDLSVICLDDTTDESSSNSDSVIVINSRKSKSESNKSKSVKKDINNDKENLKELLAKCKPVKVKINKLPKNLEKLMKLHGVTEIKNNRNKVIAKLTSKSEEHKNLDKTAKKRGRSTSVNSLLSETGSTTSTKRTKRKENTLEKTKNPSDNIKETTKERSSSSLKSNKSATGRNKTASDKSKNSDSGNESKSETGKNKGNSKIGNGTDNNSERSHDETMNNDTSEKSVKTPEKKEKQLNGKSKNTLEKSSEKFQQDKDNKSKFNDDDDVDSEIVENGIDKEPNNSNDSVEPEPSDTEKSRTEKNSDSLKKKSSSKACEEEESDNEKIEDKENSNSSSSANDPISKKRILRKDETKSGTSNEDDFRENTRRTRHNSAKLNSARKSEQNSEDGDDNEDDDEKSVSKKSSLKNDRGSSSDSDCFQQQTKKRKIIKGGDASDNNSDSDVDTDKKPKKRKRIKQVNNSDSSDDDDDNGNKGRKNIRNILKEKDLKDATKQATKNEMERKKRIEDRQKMYNIIYEDQLKKVKAIDKLVLDFDEKTKEELLTVDKTLIRQLKPHQGSGVKFMWDACFETIEQSADGSGSGCILAHCMGLGKSLQIVTLVHTLLTHSNRTNVERVLIIAPLSTVLNWVNEFRKWLAFCSKNKDIEIFELSKYKKNVERAFKLQEWYKDGGVLILGYDMFRNLVSETSGKIRKKVREQIQTSLIDPGPDMVVCDEGHLLKNEKTTLSKSVNRIKTLRRIVLTGTPLQNNLKEYYCMVQFVKPNLLGKFTEYMNRFVNPITNGQYTDSTQADIQLMKKRSHVLHKMLDGCVQRQDYSVLAPFLPPKYEYVVFVQLTELQVKLYKYYMEHKSGRIDSTQKRSSILFADFQNLQRIWTHPRILRYNSDKYEQIQQKKRDEESEEDFIVDNSSEESSSSSSSSESSRSEVNSEYNPISGKKHATASRKTRGNADEFDSEPELLEEKIENPTEWWTSMVTDNDLDSLRNSGKLMLLFSILKECESVGDKLLIFSQSLYSLDIIEHFLKIIHEKRNSKKVDENDNTCGYQGSWKLGQDYFRLDGSTSIEHRNASCKIFNNCKNTTARLFLISTRAGGLGINLVSANRVIIFDVSWNPSHDIQSIFRVYRFGQLKPCYIYRFIALGTMEEKIYERQVTKLAISKRVIDEQQIDRHYKETDLMELYRYEIEPEEPRPIPLVPKDRLFADLLQNNEKFIYKYHEHDSLLENKEEETLNEDERKVAWEEFEAEKNRPQLTYVPPRVTGPVTSNFIFGFRTDILLRLLSIKARRDNPLFNDYDVRQMVPLLLQTLHSQMEVGDGTMYKDLVNLQSELEIPSLAYSPLMSQLGMSTGISNAFLNQNMGLGGINHLVNPYAANASSASQLRAQHQQLEQYAIEQQQKMMQEQAKARLLELERNLAAGLHTEVIDLD